MALIPIGSSDDNDDVVVYVDDDVGGMLCCGRGGCGRWRIRNVSSFVDTLVSFDSGFHSFVVSLLTILIPSNQSVFV